MIIIKKCKIDGCNNKHSAKGYCHKHYTRYWRYGNPLKTNNHYMSTTSEYRTWAHMKSRCYNKNTKDYKDYGARNITVCDKWLNSFVNFLEDMGLKPFPKAQIDRIENDKGYYKENCRWTTASVNSHNRRSSILNWFTVKSIRRLFAMKKYSRKELALIYNLKICTIKSVIYNKNWKEI